MRYGRLPAAGALASALVVLLGSAAGVPAQEAPEDPLDLGIEERVDVNYVLVDFVVLDPQNRHVPNLELGDFKLKVSSRKIQAASLDRGCEVGPLGDLRDRPKESGAELARIVLAFDYDHMDETGEVFDRAQEILNSRATDREEHMLVSLGQVVRFETPFTKDLDELRWALRRMRNDRDLFAAYRQRLTERQFYERIRALFDLLERWPGRKTVVLFSGPFVEDSFTYDEQYRELAALSATTRTAVYPVDTMGLRTEPELLDPVDAIFGGPPELRRLANETGGRMTSETNDIGLAYSRAQQDMRCTYTLGFYDPQLKLDKNRRLTIKVVGRKELRVVYPDYYVVRSDEEKRTSLFETAGLAPHMFESDRIRTELIVTGARSGSWNSVVATEIRLEPGAISSAGETWDLRGYLRRPNGSIVHKFARAVAMPKDGEDRPILARTFEEFLAPPGEYALSVVLSDPRGQPASSTRPVTLPQLPKDGPFLIGPILGRGGVKSFEPLMVSDVTNEERLDALTVLCVAGGLGAGVRSTLTRWIADLAGNEVQRLEDVAVDLKGGGLQCQPVADSLGAIPLPPGHYELGATATTAARMTDESLTEFTIRGQGVGE